MSEVLKAQLYVKVLTIEMVKCCENLLHKRFRDEESRHSAMCLDKKKTFSIYDNIASPLLLLSLCEKYYHKLHIVVKLLNDKSLADLYIKLLLDMNSLKQVFSPDSMLSFFIENICTLVILV